MICVYPSDCTDFSNNGLGPVQPQSCTVTETLNGEWELTLVHPIDEMGRWTRLTEGRILRAPVPAAMTPQMSLVTQQYQTTTYDVLIYRVSTQRDPLRLRSGTGTNHKILGKYQKGTEIIVVDKTTSSWYEVTCPDGKHGYMSAEYLTYARTETYSTQINVGFHNEVIESRQLRDQSFRIYRVVPELDKVTVYARHVFYDLLDNMIQKIEPSASAVGASVAQSISSGCLSAHDFTFYSDLTTTAEDVCFENINPVEAMLGEGGMAEKYSAELARDWFDIFLVKRVGHDTDVHIRERKNLTGISYDVDETDVVTRIMPTGEDADGNILYLPELYVDSPNIGSYVHPKWIHLPVSEAKEVAEGENYKSLTECYQEMRNAARAEYEKGCDLPTVTLKVDFINCADTVEYAQYAALSNIFLGDSVRVIARRIGVEVSMRMTQYTYDCLTRKYTSVTLGTVADTLEGSMVSARQLASGSITGAKLALNSVGTGQLQSGSVGSLQIKNAAIGSAHIQDASITRAHIAEALIDVLNVNALTAVTAKIKELAAGSITADELYTSIAMIATAQLTTANIVNAQIEWAQIENLAAEIASISKAQITTATINEASIDWAAITTLSAAVASMVKADIGTADIDWAHIKDLATDTAIITQGVGGELYIAKLAVTEANLVSLTVGELVVKGTDGHFYSVSVDADGNITSTLKQVGNDDVQDVSINAGEKIIEGTITAATLNVNDIFANNAIIRSLIAANLDVDTLFAREATITAINAMDIRSNTYLRLMVSEKADKSDVTALDERVDAAELKLTPEAIVSTVTGSQQYKDDLAAISLTASGPELIVGTQTATTSVWTGNASFAELRDGQQIAYWLPFGSGSDVTLTLTLKDGTVTEAIPCYYSQAIRISTQYAAGNVLRLTYRENARFFYTTIAKGWWADANYNTDTYDRIRFSTAAKAKTAISAFHMIASDADGYFHLAANTPFDVGKPLLYPTSNLPQGTMLANTYMAYPTCLMNKLIASFQGTVSAACYLVGRLVGSTFTPAENFLTTTIPTTEDGMTYMLLGTMSTIIQMFLFPEHPLFRFVDGKFQPLSQVGYEAYAETQTVRSEMSTRFEQTQQALALKADKTVTDSLATRVAQAEEKVTAEAIVSAVRSSTLYQSDLYHARNYVLNSQLECRMIGGKYHNGTTQTDSVTVSYSVSDDLLEIGRNTSLRVSADMLRTDVDAGSATSPGVYSGIFLYFTYLNDSGQETVGGLGWYLRTTDADFRATDSDWVRLKKSPLNLGNYDVVRLNYLGVGIAHASGSTGTVRFRNLKIEVSNSFTPWSAAPEDLSNVRERMTRAESTISQHSDQIAMKVSTAIYNSEKVYRGSTAPTTLYTNMLWLDTSVSPNLLKRYTGSMWVVAGAQEVKTSGVYIGPNRVAITTENFLLQLLDPANNENVLMEMSANGSVGFKDLYADNIISKSVVPAYKGPSFLYVNPGYSASSTQYFRTFADAVKQINNRYLTGDVAILFSGDIKTFFEPGGVRLEGICGHGEVIITGTGGYELDTYFTILGCSVPISFQSLYIRECRVNSTPTGHLMHLLNSKMVSFSFCTLDCNASSHTALFAQATQSKLTFTNLYNAQYGYEVVESMGCMTNCKGSCTWALVAYSGIIFASGTIPAGSQGIISNGQLHTSGCTADSGTATPTTTPRGSTIQYATLTKSYRGGWRTDTNDVVQGVYSDMGYSPSLNWNYGCMWFGGLRGALSGQTIRSATLTLYRKTGSGSGGDRTLYLCAITNTTSSGTPSIVYRLGSIGTIGRDERLTFGLPVNIVQGLISGSYGGLCLYEEPYNFGASTYSSCYMRMAGAGEANQPYLTVVYGG